MSYLFTWVFLYFSSQVVFGIANEEASYYLSGTQEEVTSFSIIDNFDGFSYYSNLSSFPNKALVISAGSCLTRPVLTTMSIGSSPFTVSSWIKCSASSLINSYSKSLVAVAWGEPKFSNTTESDAAVLSVNGARVNVTTLAGRGFGNFVDGGNNIANFPFHLTVDSFGNIFECSTNSVRKITPDGKVTQFVGNGEPGTLDGSGTSAKIHTCYGIASDSSNFIYIVQGGYQVTLYVRQITQEGFITTRTYPPFNNPDYGPYHSIAVNSLGNVYLCTTNGEEIHMWTAAGAVTIFGRKGTQGFEDGFGTNAMFKSPRGLAADGVGNVFALDTNNFRVRKISTSGYVSTIAGNGIKGDTDGIGTNAMFNELRAMTVDSNRNIYITDNGSGSPRIRKISPNGVVSTIISTIQGFSDGIGSNAMFHSLNGIAVYNGKIFVADAGNACIRRIDASPSLPGPLPVCDDFYHHIALTYSGSSSNNLTAYIDGSTVASTSALFSISSSSSLRVGWNGLPSPNSEFFSGSLSDIRIYNQSLNANAVLMLSIPLSVSSASPSAAPLQLSSSYPPASPSVSPAAGTVLIAASVIFNGASANAYSNIQTISDLSNGIQASIMVLAEFIQLYVKIDQVTILTTNTIIYRIGSSLRRLHTMIKGRSLQVNSDAVAVRIDYTVILQPAIASYASIVSSAVVSNSLASRIVNDIKNVALLSGNIALSSSFSGNVTADVKFASPNVVSTILPTSTIYGIAGGVVAFIFLASGGTYIFYFIHRAKLQSKKDDFLASNNPTSAKDTSSNKIWKSPTAIHELDDSRGANVFDDYNIAASIRSNASNPGTVSVSSTPTTSSNTPTTSKRVVGKKTPSANSNNYYNYNSDDDDDILPGGMSKKEDSYDNAYKLSYAAASSAFGGSSSNGQDDGDGGNRAFQVASAVFDGLAQVSNVVPFVGIALKGISILMDQVDNVYRVSKDTEFLVVRLRRLQSVVQKAANDEVFCREHSEIFENMVATLQKASRKIETITNRGLLGKLVYGESDLEVFAKVDRALTMHLTEFTAAMQVETMSMIRTLYDENVGRSKLGKDDAVVAVEALPPFSMRFKTSDLLFDPPLEKQMLTAPRGSFGVVVFATWKINNNPCAVKLIPARTPTGAAAFSIMSWLSEAELMRRLREHLNSVTRQPPKNICVLFGIGAIETPNGDPSHYLVVMERLQGSLRELLDSYLKKGRQPALEQALNWLRNIANGISECHDANVVHSDIKAANVLLTSKREAKVGDLGAGRVTRDISATASVINSTGGNVVRGSLPWLSSELIEDQSMQPSKASDVYAWACVCWEILSCRIPYHNESGELVEDLTKLRSLNAIVSGKLRPDLSVLRPDAPQSIVEIMKRAWNSEPRDRPTIDEILETLDAAIASFKQAKKGTSVRAAEAAAADLRSEALLTAAAKVEEEDARKAAVDLEALTTSLEAARASRIEAIRRKHDEVAEKIRRETEAEQRRLEEDYKLELDAEIKLNEAKLKLRKAQWMGEIAEAKDLRLQNASQLDENDRHRILAEFESEQRSVEQRVEAVRAEQARALEDRLRARKDSKRKAADEKQKQLDEETEKEVAAEKAKRIHDFLLD